MSLQDHSTVRTIVILMRNQTFVKTKLKCLRLLTLIDRSGGGIHEPLSFGDCGHYT